MSPDNKKKLNLIRIKLDKLDNKLLSLIKYRTSLVKEVLKLKEFKKEIVDQKRINFILNNLINKRGKLFLNSFTQFLFIYFIEIKIGWNCNEQCNNYYS